MVIQFLLPIAGIAGGVKVAYEYANYLHEQGHQVRILYPGVLFPNTESAAWRAEAAVRKLKYAADKMKGPSEGARWFPLQVPLIHVPSLESRYVPNADITIATGNETAEWAAKLPSRCGKLFYFIQGHETWSRDEQTLNDIYRLPLRKIVIAHFLKNIVEKAGAEVWGIAPNGVDTDFFNGTGKVLPVPPRILMLSHDSESKGIPDGLAAVARVRQEMPEARLVMFGAHAPRPDMPPGTEYHQDPRNELPGLYAGASIFLCSSRNEAWGLPATEAMASGTAVVATDAGGITDFAINGKTALIVPPRDSAAMAEAMLRLLRDESLLTAIGTAGQKHIRKHFTLTEACRRFEELVTGQTPA